MAKRGGFPGGMPGNMNNLMKQAQKMQKQNGNTAGRAGSKGIQCGSRRRCCRSNRLPVKERLQKVVMTRKP